MFRVRITSGIDGMHRRALRNLETAPDRMKQILDQKAAEERRTHGYQNRTGDLEASTLATDVIEVGDTRVVQLEASMEYASYVNRHPRGLMNIDALAAEAEREIDYMLDGDIEGLDDL